MKIGKKLINIQLQSCSIIVRTHSNTNQLPSTEILRVEQHCESGSVDGIELSPVGYMIVGNFDNSEYTPHICNITISSGETLYALVFKLVGLNSSLV